MTDPDPDLAGTALTRTRASLHAVAELLLAGPQYRRSRTIELRVSPGGFRTSAEPAAAVVGTDLVVGGARFPMSGRTVRGLAAAAGTTASDLDDVYPDGSGAGPDDELVVDAGAATLIAEAYARGDAALRRLDASADPVLWPEHFDVGLRLDEVNYGVSPGDGFLPEPYAYVGVDPVPAGDPFWNAPFGVAVPMSSLADAAAVLDLFTDARRRLG